MLRPRLSLATLPEDVLYLILEHLDTARDTASVGRTCRKLHAFMQSRGWRAFTRRCFPWLPPSGRPTTEAMEGGPPRLRWDQIADSLTWQSRAWDRRSLAFQAMLPRGDYVARPRRQESFRPPLAVHFQADLGSGVDGEEMVVWGAGEDVVARYRRRGRRVRLSYPDALADTDADADADALDPAAVARWHVLDGKQAGFQPGYDDVRALAVVPNVMGQQRRRGILAGRDNGDLSLLSAETDGSFGRLLARFLPGHHSSSGGRAIDQRRLFSLDVTADDHGSRLAAVTTPSHILFYPLPDETGGPDSICVSHAASFDLSSAGLDIDSRRRPYSARWLASDGLLAVGMDHQQHQLSYLTATPDGFTLTAAAKSRASAQGTLLLPSSLEPVNLTAVAGGGGNLLLSSWRDGTTRLQDVRTASAWDLAYQDNVMPSTCSQALLVLDGERFMAGNQESATLKFFDFRWPKRYTHTAALPCGGHLPFPSPPIEKRAATTTTTTTTMLQPPRLAALAACCDHRCGQRCRWHAAAAHLFYRPNCSVYLQRSLASHIRDAGVWSLARATASDLAPPNFYAGLNSCVVEGSLSARALPPSAVVPDDGGGDGAGAGDGATRPLLGSVVCAPAPRGDPWFAYPDVLEQRPPSLTQPPDPPLWPANAATTNAANAANAAVAPALFQGWEHTMMQWRRRQYVLRQRHHYYRTIDLHVSLLETGDGLADVHSDEHARRLPRMRQSRPGRSVVVAPGDARLETDPPWWEQQDDDDDDDGPLSPARQPLPLSVDDVHPMLRQRHRLDYGLQHPDDFQAFYSERPESATRELCHDRRNSWRRRGR